MTTGVNTSFPVGFGIFDGLQAVADQASRELVSTGEAARKRAAATAGGLTVWWAQIAQLGWDGCTNPEVSTRLSIGPRQARRHVRKARSSKPAGLTSFAHIYPGGPEQVRRVRADLEAFLNGCPIADETILVASELAANAVTHSSSRQPGGRFIVRAAVCPGDWVWVDVEDQGGIWAGHHPRDGRPHGLDIVQAIAGDGNWGIGGDATPGRVAWARLDWPGR